jgi:spermidine synthase
MHDTSEQNTIANLQTFDGELLFKTRALCGSLEIRERDGLRWMHFGSEAVQSAMLVRAPYFPVVPYTQFMLGSLLFQNLPHNILLLGLGGGGLYRFFFQHYFPDAGITAVERDPQFIEVAQRYFNVSGDAEHHVTAVDDAANFLVTTAPAGYDLLLADLFDIDRFSEIYRNEEFYSRCSRTLGEPGIGVFNLLVRDADDFEFVLQLIREHFNRHTLVSAVPDYRNIIVFAFKKAPVARRREQFNEVADKLRHETGFNFSFVIDQLFENNPVAHSKLVI